MYIIKGIRADKERRILLNGLYDKVPERVAVILDSDKKKLFFADNEKIFQKISKSNIRKVDKKSRVCLPKWVIDELGDYFILTTESLQEHSLVPAKFIIL